jgi:hypothetical protein
MRLANHTTNDAFFLLRPGKYTVAPSKNTPFRLTDVN